MRRLAGSRVLAWAAVAVVCATGNARAQMSTGTIVGLVKDVSGAVVAGAEVEVTRQQTGLERILVASEDGRYAATLLPPGVYVVRARTSALRSPALSVLVQSGVTASVQLVLELNPVVESATVRATDRLRDDHHEIGGWIDRADIEQQPLNGRNVLELTKLEPGVTSPARLSGGRLFIAPLGAGLNPIPRVGFTRVTVDGASIETPGTVGSLLQVSPDGVEQIQISTANFDMATGLATSGAVDVVTRSGGNRHSGSAFSTYRDRRWSAYSDDAAVPASSPSFRRYQAGAMLSGPVRTGSVFFFLGYERHDQRDVITVRPADSAFAPLGGTFGSPYSGTLFNGRVDIRATDRQHLFVRHTHDTSHTVVPADGSLSLPSGWSRRPIRAHQTLAALTSTFAAQVVNDLRISYYATHTTSDPTTSADCPAPCLGFGAPRIVLSDGGPAVLTLGAAFSAANVGRRFQISDALVWQRHAHLVRVGVDVEHTAHSLSSGDNDPVTLTLWTPAATAARDPSLTLPASFTSVEDLLKLPLRSFTTSVGSDQVMQRGFQSVRRFAMFRAHAADEWHVGPRVTVNGGLAWSYERGVLNDDLTKPRWLEPLTGGTRRVPAAFGNLSGAFGVAWRATADNRTVVRAGAGRYTESIARTVGLNLANERVLLSPLGTSRLVTSGSNLVWDGRRLNFPQPTSFTGSDLLGILPEIRSSLEQSLNPGNRDGSVVNLDVTKEGRNLYDPSYSAPNAVHASVGVERQLGNDIVVGADVVWKHFSHTFINGIDYNRFLSAGGPVIPACTAADRGDVRASCSNGSLFFDTTSGRARYAGLLVRAEKRLRGAARILAAYALGSFVGNNGTGTGTTETPDGRVFGFNNDDWSENYGPLPTDLRHVLNVSGLVIAPLDINVSFNVSAYSRSPFSAYVAGVDFNGDGTLNDLLPGTRVNQFNRGLSRGDLVRLVADYNAAYAGDITAGGQRAPFVTLPNDFTFNDNFFTLDVRVARDFILGSSARVSIFLDVFNVFDTLNLVGFSGNLAAPNSFGQPSARLGQAFGSGGPRAAQLGLRVGF